MTSAPPHNATHAGAADLCVHIGRGVASVRGPMLGAIEERGLHCALVGAPRWSGSRAGSAAIGDAAAALLDLYMARGPALLEQLSGAFAFCIVDLPQRRTLAAADRMGTWRLHYAQGDDGLRIATSLTALVQSCARRPEIDLQALYDYVYFHMIPAPRTVFSGVRTLLRAEFLQVTGTQVDTRRYWRPAWTADVADDSPAHAQARELLQRAVVRCLGESAGNTACFLSGGLDSSSVAGMAARVRSPRSMTAFSVGFDEPAYDESEFARAAADAFRLDWHRYELRADEAAASLPSVAAAFEQPFGNSSALAVYHCVRSARERGYTRMLAGDGGDEIFGGNSRYAKQLLFERFASWPGWVRRGVVAPSTALAARSLPLAAVRKLDSYVRQANVPLPDRLQSYNFLHRHAAEEVFVPGLLARMDRTEPIRMLRTEYAASGSTEPVDRMLFLDWQYTLQDNDLVKVNTMCRHAGVEVSYPMLDDELVEFSCRIRADDKVRKGDLRRFYRRAMRGFLPDAIIDKTKHGFGLPFGVWTRSHAGLKHQATQAINALRRRNLFNPAFLDRALALHGDVHAAYYGELVWILMVLELWLEAHAPDLQF